MLSARERAGAGDRREDAPCLVGGIGDGERLAEPSWVSNCADPVCVGASARSSSHTARSIGYSDSPIRAMVASAALCRRVAVAQSPLMAASRAAMIQDEVTSRSEPSSSARSRHSNWRRAAAWGFPASISISARLPRSTARARCCRVAWRSRVTPVPPRGLRRSRSARRPPWHSTLSRRDRPRRARRASEGGVGDGPACRRGRLDEPR